MGAREKLATLTLQLSGMAADGKISADDWAHLQALIENANQKMDSIERMLGALPSDQALEMPWDELMAQLKHQAMQ